MLQTQTTPSELSRDTAPTAHTHPTGFRKWLPMLIIALSLAIIVIDGTVLNVSQKSVINDLNTDLKTIQWAFTSYSLVLAALTIFGGRLGDIFGRKKMFRLGAILFALGSFLTTISPNVGILILGWSIIEGIGASLMTPAASALIVSNYQGKDRGTAFAIFGATAGGASAFGPIIGGVLARYGANISNLLSWLTQSIPSASQYFANFSGWRWAFGINVLIVALLLLGSRIIKDTHEAKRVNLDLVGVALSSLGLTSIVYGLIESSTYGWFQTNKAYEIFGNIINLGGISITVYSIILGILLMIGYVFWEFRVEKTGKEPMVRLEIFKNTTFTFGILTLTTLFAGFTGIITYGLIFYFLTVLKFDSLTAGLALIPFSLMTFFMAPVSAKLAHKYNPKLIVQIGLILILVGSGLFYLSFFDGATAWNFVPGEIVFGSGFGLMVAQINNLILSSVETKLAGVASGINGTIREIGRTFGVALIGAAFISTLGSTLKTNLENNAQIPVQAKSSIIKSIDEGEIKAGTSDPLSDEAVVKLGADSGAINGIMLGAKQSGAEMSIQNAENSFLENYRSTEAQITKEVGKSITTASKQSIVFTGGFALLSFAMSFGIGKPKHS